MHAHKRAVITCVRALKISYFLRPLQNMHAPPPPTIALISYHHAPAATNTRAHTKCNKCNKCNRPRAPHITARPINRPLSPNNKALCVREFACNTYTYAGMCAPLSACVFSALLHNFRVIFLFLFHEFSLFCPYFV